MNTYRLVRRFSIQAVGVTLLMAGIVLSVALVLPEAGAWVAVGVAVLLFGRAGWLWLRPPVVARSDAESLVLGGPLTVRPVRLAWGEIEDVSSDETRLYLRRGDESVLVFPLAYVGERRIELLRDIHDRLNTANGYERFDLG